jgi:predicted TIM-barrel fold metal-dependent hydrolase
LKTLRLPIIAALITLVMVVASFRVLSLLGSPAADAQDATLRAFAAITPIDAHAHLYNDNEVFAQLMRGLNLRILNICVIDDRDPYGKALEPQRTDVLKVRHVTGGRAVFCTTFSPYDFETAGFKQRVERQLGQDFAKGAVAVKIYKVMGMEMRSKAGKYIMPDDPTFEPIYQFIAAQHRIIVAHLAEPDSCWQPPNPASPDYSYYKEHPEEYAYAHPEWPSKAAILAARDHLLAQNPNLRVVGAHLGSMETDVDQIARRFDRYPNFAVDTAARVPYFMLQPREKVRAFLIKYQDRVLYATDLVVMPTDDAAKAVQEWRKTYARDWKFFATDQTVEYMGHNYQGLSLPRPTLQKIFHDNAIHWFPGFMGTSRRDGTSR